MTCVVASCIIFKIGQPRPLLVYFRSFQVLLQFLKQIKNIHPVYGARIQTHNLWNMSPFPEPLD